MDWYTEEMLAGIVNGRDISMVLTDAECEVAKDSGLVVAYCYSDDTLCLRGAIHADLTIAAEDTTVYIHKTGKDKLAVVSREQHHAFLGTSEKLGIPYSSCPIHLKYSPNGPDTWPTWVSLTPVPHTPITLMDASDIGCIGLIINVKKLK